LYVLLGCGGLALLMCLGFGVFFVFVAKKGSDFAAGMTDPAVKEENARKQLGGVPQGYTVVASVSVFGLMDTTVLADKTVGDGGVADDARLFQYFHVIGNEKNKQTKAFFKGESDTQSLRQANISLRPEDILKRGQLTVDGRKLYYVASRGEMNLGGAPNAGLHNAVLFDCPGDALWMGVWTQPDPDPAAKSDALELAGTVADEAELARFLKPIEPCGR
jgi:hypothetical protein